MKFNHRFNFEVSPSKLEECKEVLKYIEKFRLEIKEIKEFEYPLELYDIRAGLRFVLRSTDDVDYIIEKLKEEIKEVENCVGRIASHVDSKESYYALENMIKVLEKNKSKNPKSVEIDTIELLKKATTSIRIDFWNSI